MRAPVLCWPLDDETWVGRLLFCGGSSAEIARGSVAAVLSALAEELRRGGLPEPLEVEEPVLRRFTVPIRPRWQIGERTLYSPDAIELAVDVVHARTISGLRIADLPRLNSSFHFEDLEHLEVLVAQAVRDATAGLPPERLLGHLVASPPVLDDLVLRDGDVASRPRKDAVPERLAAVATKMPEPTRPSLVPVAAWEREMEVKRAVGLLGAGAPFVIVGEPRVGKTAVLRQALHDVTGERTFWRTTAHRMIAGAKFLGEWQELVDQLVEDLEEVDGTLWIDDLGELVAIGGSSVEDSVAAYLQPALTTGRLPLVGELTPRAFDSLRTALPGFFGLFEAVPVAELAPASVRHVVALLAGSFQTHHGLALAPEARALAIGLTERHLPGERMPGKVVSFLGACAADAAREGRAEIREAHVLDAFVRRTGMPRILVDDRAPLLAADLRARLGERIVAQPAALDAAVRVILAFKAGLADPGRPIATLLFAGPTGVGKTATARAVADWCFGEGQSSTPLVRIDMSELQHPAQVGRLLGDARTPGELVRQIRERPFSVLLLDEIEKAHPLFFDTLMTVLDEGTLTDGLGRVTDFRRTIVVMTTNLGSAPGGSLGFGERVPATSLAEVRRHFRPEFYNRIDEVVSFRALDADAIARIAVIELDAVSRREGLRTRRLTVRYGEALVDRVARAGFDPRWGARLLQRTIEQEVVSPLARFLLENPALTDATIYCDLERGRTEIVSL